MTEPRLSLQRLAKLAGVSKMTVSRALRSAYGVAPATRERILALARKHNFSPDPSLTRVMHVLRNHRRHAPAETLAYIFCHRSASPPPRSPTQLAFYAGIARRARQLGYGLDHFDLGPHVMSARRLAQILRARGIRGSIISGFLDTPEPLDPIFECTACCAGGMANPGIRAHRARVLPFQIVRLALDELAALGYRRIGLYLDRQTDLNQSHAWRAAVENCAITDGWNPAEAVHLVPTWTRADFLGWVASSQPGAVLTLHAESLKWLRSSAGPRSVGFALLDRHTEHTGFAGVDQRAEAIGVAAVDLVAARLLSDEIGPAEAPHVISVSGRWIPGPSAPGIS